MIASSRPITCVPNLCAFRKGYGEAVVGCERKRWGGRAREMAAWKGLPWLLLEDGFLRLVERKDAALSLVVEDLGIYYDTSGSYAFFRTSWVPRLRHLKALSACEPIIDMPHLGPD